MTAITINLLAEEQKAQEARARDPVKLFIAIGLGILTVVVAWGGTLAAMVMQKHADLQVLQARWDKMNGTGAGEGEFQRLNTLSDEILALNRSRILMAPQLALVKDLIPPSVQLTQLGLAISLDTDGADSHADKRVARAIRSKRLVVRFEGMVLSARPELEVDQFLQALRADPRFGSRVEDIQLRSISRTAKDVEKGGRSSPAANFIIECWYKDAGAK